MNDHEQHQIDPSTATRGPVVALTARRIAALFAGAMVATATFCTAMDTPTAAADQCADVEVIFARGTGEPPGVGGVGQGFVDSLRSLSGGRSVGVYAVDYPASGDFSNRTALAQTVVDGIADASARVQSVATDCPGTRIVIGGYSQGAVVAGFTTSAAVPEGVSASAVPAPMPPGIASHVAAVVLFALPSDRFLRENGAPPVVIGPDYDPKTIELCDPADTICNGADGGAPTVAHVLYPVNGMVGEGASFAASRL